MKYDPEYNSVEEVNFLDLTVKDNVPTYDLLIKDSNNNLSII